MKNWREKLIISADDFGLNAKSNDGILKLARLGKIDQASVMARGHFVPDEIRALKNSGIILDIHLEIPRLSNGERSVFLRLVKFFRLYFSGKINSAKLETEWETQIEEFKKIFGKYPDGLNSHEYVHFFPSCFKITLKLCQKFGIKYIRFGRNGDPFRYLNPVSFIIHFLRRIDKAAFQKSGLASSESMASFDWIKNPEKFFQNLPPGKTELVFHPEYENELEAILKYF